MSTDAGIFIALEGTDGSGKGTQFTLLTDRLRTAGYTVTTVDIPRYDHPSSYFVKQYLNGAYGTVDEVGPYTASLFYALDRYEAAAEIREALAAGHIVLANRFTGSNMAHQGTKFPNAEQRRGYFIWIDNLEFELLRIPRPTLNIVLRVPAEIAMTLVERKDQRSYTDKKKDIHEADAGHQQKTVEVYDDLCNLFPKDFLRLDCVRGGQLLDIETVHNLLWEKVRPLLPEVPPPSAGPTDNGDAPVAPSTATPLALQPPAVLSMVINQASNLLAARVAEVSAVQLLEVPPVPPLADQSTSQAGVHYYVPAHFNATLKQHYCEVMDQLLEIYAKIHHGLASHQQTIHADQAGPTTAWAATQPVPPSEIAQQVLPLAFSGTVGLTGDASAMSELISHLRSLPGAEAQAAGEQLRAHFHQIRPETLTNDEPTAVRYKQLTAAGLRDVAEELLPDTYALEGNRSVHLADYQPHNEFTLLPEMLYAFTNQPLNDLRTAIDSWPYEQKLRAFTTYIGERSDAAQTPGPLLEQFRYDWELSSDFAAFHTMQQQTTVAMAHQAFSPRYGYDVPGEIEAADLTELYEKCFMLSLELYSAIQAAGYSDDAEYAVLRGHKLHWTLSHTASQAFQLYEHIPPRASVSYQALTAAMYAELADRHPLMAEAIRFAR
jgi:dTMP kinase